MISCRLTFRALSLALLATGLTSCIFFDNFEPTEEQDIDPQNAEALTRKKCTRCHTFARIEKNPRITWLPTVLRMRYLRLSEMNDDEMTRIIEFLDRSHGLPDCPLVENGDGSELVEQVCRRCHRVDRIFHQVKDEWRSTINRMRDANLCGVTDDQATTLATYLESTTASAHVTAACGHFAQDEDDLDGNGLPDPGDTVTYVLSVHNRNTVEKPMTLTAQMPDGIDEIMEITVEGNGTPVEAYEDLSGDRYLELTKLRVPGGGSIRVTLRARVAASDLLELDAELDIDEDGNVDVTNHASVFFVRASNAGNDGGMPDGGGTGGDP